MKLEPRARDCRVAAARALRSTTATAAETKACACPPPRPGSTSGFDATRSFQERLGATLSLRRTWAEAAASPAALAGEAGLQDRCRLAWVWAAAAAPEVRCRRCKRCLRCCPCNGRRRAPVRPVPPFAVDACLRNCVLSSQPGLPGSTFPTGSGKRQGGRLGRVIRGRCEAFTRTAAQSRVVRRLRRWTTRARALEPTCLARSSTHPRRRRRLP